MSAIEAALLPGDKLGADLGRINGLVPTPPGEAENQVPGLVPTPEKHLTHHQSKGTHLNQFASKKHTHSIINLDSMRTAGLMDPQDCPSVIETLPTGDGVAQDPTNPDRARSVAVAEGSWSKNNVLSGETKVDNGNRGGSALSDSSVGFLRAGALTDTDTVPGQQSFLTEFDNTFMTPFFDIFTELGAVGDEPRDFSAGAAGIDGDSKGDGHGIWTTGSSSGIWTDGTMLNLQPQIGSEHFPPPRLHDSVHCLVNNLWHDAIPEEDELGITFPDWLGPPGISAAQCQGACYVVEGKKNIPLPSPNMETPILENLTLNTILQRPVVLYAEEGGQE